MEKKLTNKTLLFILLAVPALFLLTGLVRAVVNNKMPALAEDLTRIVLSRANLFTDFIELGGVEAALLNVAVVALFNLLLIYIYKLEINGFTIAAYFTVIGFAFFGKNLYNIFSIYIGGHLYAKLKRIPLKNVIIPLMFATALAPVVSEISFASIIPSPLSSIVALLVGIIIGLIIIPVSSHMLRFHDGYNLYNIGFTAGIIGTLHTAFLRSFGASVEPVSIISDSNHPIIIWLLFTIFTSMLALALLINIKAFKEYKKILSKGGRLVTDFTNSAGYAATFLNMSVMGLLSLVYVLAIGGVVNGPVLAGIFTIAGFSAFGKHLKNCIPVMSGTILSALIFGYELSETAIIVSVLFSTTLAPIAGKFGLLCGLLAGVTHMAVVTNVGFIHGGVNLYNNGFSGGIVASVLVPIIETFRKGDKDD